MNRVRISTVIEPGAFYVMADYSHPEAEMLSFGFDAVRGVTSSPAPDPDGSVVICHPNDEQKVRDALALLGEREDVNAVLTRLRRNR